MLLQCLGICTIISAEHVRNAAGKPGGRVGLRLDDGKLVSVRLSDVRNYAFVEETTTERHTPVAGEIIRHEFGKESDGGQ